MTNNKVNKLTSLLFIFLCTKQLKVIEQDSTNVTLIIQTHNILTSHNPNPWKPPQTHKKCFIIYGFVSQQVTSEKLLWELYWMIFLRLMP